MLKSKDQIQPHISGKILGDIIELHNGCSVQYRPLNISTLQVLNSNVKLKIGSYSFISSVATEMSRGSK